MEMEEQAKSNELNKIGSELTLVFTRIFFLHFRVLKVFAKWFLFVRVHLFKKKETRRKGKEEEVVKTKCFRLLVPWTISLQQNRTQQREQSRSQVKTSSEFLSKFLFKNLPRFTFDDH